jgi:O-antigen/teichoic acid export membrane protein
VSTPAPPADEATRGVLGRGSLYTVATAAPALAALAVLPLVTRLLSATEYGVVAVVLVVVQVGLILLGLGLGAAVTRTAVIEAHGAERAAALVLQGAACSVLLGLVLVASGPLWGAAVLGVPWSAAQAWAVGAATAGSVVILVQSWLRGGDRVGAYVGLGLVANLGGPVAGLLLVAAVAPRAELYALGLAAGQAAAAAAGLVLLARAPRGRSAGVLRDGLRVGLPTLPHQVSLYVAVGGLVLVATHLLGPAAGGRANIVLTIGVGGAVLVSAMNNAWAPAVYRAAPEDRPAVLDETTARIGLLAACVGGGIALAGPWLLRFLAPPDYGPRELTGPLALVTAATVVSVVYLASGHLVFASGRTSGLALTTPLSVAAGLAVGALLTPVAGLAGLASGYLAVYLLLALATTGLQRRVSSSPWWPPGMPAAVAVAAAATVGGALLPTTGPGALVRPLGVLVVAAVAAGVVVRVFRPRPA